MKRLMIFIAVLLLFLQSTIFVSAAEGNVIYDGNASEFIFEPGSNYSPTDLFVSFKDVIPGDSIVQKITIKNDVRNSVNIRVYLRSLGAQPGSENFLSQMKLRVEAPNATKLFDANADQTAQLTEWTYLGTLYSGGKVDLDVILDVPVTMDNQFSNSVGYLDWEFKVDEFPIEVSSGTKTGDHAKTVFWAGCLVVSGIGIVLIRKKNKKD